jgi:hypothetical protein
MLQHSSAMLLLQGWPLPRSTAVWVLTSTSGASPMTNAARTAPYQVPARAWPGMPGLRFSLHALCPFSVPHSGRSDSRECR